MPTIDYDEVIRIIKGCAREGYPFELYGEEMFIPPNNYKRLVSIFLDKQLAAEEMEIAKKRYR